MPRNATPLTLAAAAGTSVGLCIFGVLAFGGSGHAETLSPKPLSAIVALRSRAPSLPVAAPREAQDRSGRTVRVIYPGPYAQR
ncbi:MULTISPECIES: hypothetical protein [unclassified Methylobacterium]|uniref:hypothetical protein n=1 Tax=unclassified Methylobacterium TaxID=2615210 RepID=UPI001FB99731|nr:MULTISPECIES: hypothetical protein [unclassified Methylobacterium]MCJ2016921.1 hypothetical protein [Methylobacterium sp. E-065]